MGMYMKLGNIKKGDATQEGFEGSKGWMNIAKFPVGRRRAAEDQD